jgi:hypothetical protein
MFVLITYVSNEYSVVNIPVCNEILQNNTSENS